MAGQGPPTKVHAQSSYENGEKTDTASSEAYRVLPVSWFVSAHQMSTNGENFNYQLSQQQHMNEQPKCERYVT